jgi:hypothetical protein
MSQKRELPEISVELLEEAKEWAKSLPPREGREPEIAYYLAKKLADKA